MVGIKGGLALTPASGKKHDKRFKPNRSVEMALRIAGERHDEQIEGITHRGGTVSRDGRVEVWFR